MSTLHSQINALAEAFAHDLLRALRGASLEEIIHETSAGHAGQVRRGPGRPPKVHAVGAVAAPARSKRKAGRLARRSMEDITKAADKIIAIVKSSKNGINAEGIKAALKIDRRELPKPLAMALKSKKIHKKGQKRATTYFA